MKFIISRSRLTVEVNSRDAEFSEVDTTNILSKGDHQAFQTLYIKLPSAFTDVSAILSVLKKLPNVVNLIIEIKEEVLRTTQQKDFLKTTIIRLILACKHLETLDLSQVKISSDQSNILMSQLHTGHGSKLKLIAPLSTESKPKVQAPDPVSASGVLIYGEDENYGAKDIVVDNDWVVPDIEDSLDPPDMDRGPCPP